MLFNSAHFLLFFPVVTLIYFLLPQKNNRLRTTWLLIASYYFYMCWNAVYALLMLTSTVVTFISGRLINWRRETTKLWVILSLLINLGILFFFKYQNFVADSICSLFSFIGIDWRVPTIDVLLPVGISFYTFQAIGYTLDVSRKNIEPEKDFITYALFVSFFPQLVAGPIERSGNLLHQLKATHRFNFERVRNGLILMLWGFFQKLVIADRLAQVVDIAYKAPEIQSGARLIVATVLFAIQIYCDFASYSNIAIGTARILDIQLMKNFNHPYFSTSISDFWRRWHISLSTWLRDYIYIPLGGNRRGIARKYVNLMIVFLISGLWHGADWTFIIWGAIHGIYQITGGTTQKIRNKIWKKLGFSVDGKIVKTFRTIITFILVDFAWIFFRANNLTDAIVVIRRIFLSRTTSASVETSLTFGQNYIWILSAAWGIFVLFVVSLWQEKTGSLNSKGQIVPGTMERFIQFPLIVRWSICLVLLFSILFIGVWNTSGFIYFQF